MKLAEDLQPELAVEVKRLLAKFSPSEKPLTSREAANVTGLSHATVAKMLRGLPVGRFATKKLSERLGGDVNLLLSLSGYQVEESVDLLKPTTGRSGLEHPITKPLMKLDAFTAFMQYGHKASEPADDANMYVESWSRGVRVEGATLEPEYRHGDILLIQEYFVRLDGKEFLVVHNGNPETGFFIRVGSRNYQLNEDSTQLNLLSGEYQFLGKIVGCLREDQRL